MSSREPHPLVVAIYKERLKLGNWSTSSHMTPGGLLMDGQHRMTAATGGTGAHEHEHIYPGDLVTDRSGRLGQVEDIFFNEDDEMICARLRWVRGGGDPIVPFYELEITDPVTGLGRLADC